MLILSRRVGDAILVEGGIRIVILACDRKGVRIGVEAPPEVSILREEIVAQIASENRRAHATAEARDLFGVKPTAPVTAPTPDAAHDALDPKTEAASPVPRP